MNVQRIVLDTNCLVQSLPSRSQYHRIWTDFIDGRYNLCVSNEILNEYEEIISRYASPNVARNVVEAIIHSPFAVYKESHFRFHLIVADPDDNKFVDCAIAAGAQYVVSEDSHFGILRSIPFPKVDVIGLDEFLKLLTE